MRYILILFLSFSVAYGQPTNPSGLTTTVVQGGVRLDWVDNSDDEYGFEIWASIDDGDYAVIDSVAANDTSYTDLREGSYSMKYKVRAKNGFASSYSNTQTSEPLEFVLTSTGNGSGMAILNFEVSQTTTMSISGAGRFYTNYAGTTGESTTKVVTTGALRRFYIKVPSGSATLRIKNVVTKWGEALSGGDTLNDGWHTTTIANANPDLQGLNYPSISTDVSKMTNLTSINVFGLNTIYGDISDLDSLTYIEIGTGQANHTAATHGSTCTGDISGMTKLVTLDSWDKTNFTGDISGLTKLEVLWVGGLNSFTGSLENMDSLRTCVIYPTNTFHPSGDVSGLTKLQYLQVTNGNNTLSGSIAGLVNLCQFDMNGTSSVTIPNVTNLTKLSYLTLPQAIYSSANVNQILADFWANKDVAKTSTLRYISC